MSAVTRVPGRPAHCSAVSSPASAPALNTALLLNTARAVRDTIVTLATAHSEDSASPRNP